MGIVHVEGEIFGVNERITHIDYLYLNYLVESQGLFNKLKILNRDKNFISSNFCLKSNKSAARKT